MGGMGMGMQGNMGELMRDEQALNSAFQDLQQDQFRGGITGMQERQTDQQLIGLEERKLQEDVKPYWRRNNNNKCPSLSTILKQEK